MVTMTIAMMFDNEDDLIYKHIELENKYLNWQIGLGIVSNVNDNIYNYNKCFLYLYGTCTRYVEVKHILNLEIRSKWVSSFGCALLRNILHQPLINIS